MQSITPTQALALALNHLDKLRIGEGKENATHYLEAYVLIEKAKDALTVVPVKQEKKQQEQSDNPNEQEKVTE